MILFPVGEEFLQNFNSLTGCSPLSLAQVFGGDGSPVQQQNLTAELHEGFKPRESLQSKQPNLIRARQQLKEHSIVAWSSNLVINQENQSGRSSECCAEKPRMTPGDRQCLSKRSDCFILYSGFWGTL